MYRRRRQYNAKTVAEAQKMVEQTRALARQHEVPHDDVVRLFQELHHVGRFSRLAPIAARAKWWELLGKALYKSSALEILVLGIIASTIPNCLEMPVWQHFRLIQYSLVVSTTLSCYLALVAIGIKVQPAFPHRFYKENSVGCSLFDGFESGNWLPPLPSIIHQCSNTQLAGYPAKDSVTGSWVLPSPTIIQQCVRNGFVEYSAKDPLDRQSQHTLGDLVKSLIAAGANPNQLFYEGTKLKHLLDLKYLKPFIGIWLIENTATNPFYSINHNPVFRQRFITLHPWSSTNHHLYQDQAFQATVFTFIAFHCLLRSDESFFTCLPIEVLFIIIEHLAASLVGLPTDRKRRVISRKNPNSRPVFIQTKLLDFFTRK